jgi:hypothetical protein
MMFVLESNVIFLSRSFWGYEKYAENIHDGKLRKLLVIDDENVILLLCTSSRSFAQNSFVQIPQKPHTNGLKK